MNTFCHSAHTLRSQYRMTKPGNAQHASDRILGAMEMIGDKPSGREPRLAHILPSDLVREISHIDPHRA